MHGHGWPWSFKHDYRACFIFCRGWVDVGQVAVTWSPLLPIPMPPIIVFDVIATGLEQDFCSNMFEPLVQFSIFGDGNNKSSNSVLQIGHEFVLLYGDVLLPMDGGYTMIRNDTVGQRKNARKLICMNEC